MAELGVGSQLCACWMCRLLCCGLLCVPDKDCARQQLRDIPLVRGCTLLATASAAADGTANSSGPVSNTLLMAVCSICGALRDVELLPAVSGACSCKLAKCNLHCLKQLCCSGAVKIQVCVLSALHKRLKCVSPVRRILALGATGIVVGLATYGGCSCDRSPCSVTGVLAVGGDPVKQQHCVLVLAGG